MQGAILTKKDHMGSMSHFDKLLKWGDFVQPNRRMGGKLTSTTERARDQ